MLKSFMNSSSYIGLQIFLEENRDSINNNYNLLYRFKKNMNRFDYFDSQLSNLDSELLKKCGISNWDAKIIGDYYYFSIEYDYHYDINLYHFGYRVYQVAFNSVTGECFFSNMLVFPEMNSTQLYFIENFEAYLQQGIECYYFTREQEGDFLENKTFFSLLLFENNTDFINRDGIVYKIGEEKKYNF